MDKKQIVKFLKGGRRGIYNIIVQQYSQTVLSMGAAMSLEIIKEDLEKETAEEVELKYFSLAQAISKFKKDSVRSKGSTTKKWDFKDSHELGESADKPGRFK